MHFGLRKSRVARNVSNRMPTKLNPSRVKLEKKEGAWTTCCGVNDSIIIIIITIIIIIIIIIIIMIIIIIVRGDNARKIN